MPANIVNMPMSEVTKDMVLTVKLIGTKRFRFGLWLFKLAVICAAKIGGFGVKVEREEANKEGLIFSDICKHSGHVAGCRSCDESAQARREKKKLKSNLWR